MVGSREPARLYLMDETTIPTILPYASDRTYATAMQSVDAMKDFVDTLTRSFDVAADMDWRSGDASLGRDPGLVQELAQSTWLPNGVSGALPR